MPEKFKIDVIRKAPNALVHDLTVKFNDDLGIVLKKNFDVMQSVLAPNETASILLSGMAVRGIRSDQELTGEVTLFLRYVGTAMKALEK